MSDTAAQKIVLFDFDGVLVETFQMCLELAQLQYPDLTTETYRDFSDGNIYELIAQRNKVSPPVHKIDYFVAYTPLLMKHEPVRGVDKILHTLAGKHPLIIVSSTIESPIEDYLSKYELSKYFAEILGKQNGTSKVKKIQDVIDRYHVSPDNVVFVTDTLGDIREGRKVGVKTIGVTWGFHPKERLVKGGPNAIVETPDKLLAAIEAELA